MTQQDQDYQCLLRAQGGDPRSLAELYDRYSSLLYPVALRILRSVSDAEDALQDTWLQVWRRSATYDPRRGTVAAWFLTIVRSRALDRYRSLASRSRAESKLDPEPLKYSNDASSSASLPLLSARVREALASLPPQQRQVLEIAYFEGLSQTEIAARLRAPLGTVKSWARQGLMRLRELMPEEEWV
jgi:RNA polymerase sigma-70 factor (ECF subfamily)